MTKVALVTPLKRKANSKGNHKRVPNEGQMQKAKPKGDPLEP